MPPSDESPDASSPSMLSLIGRGLARGLVNAFACSIGIALAGWIAFALIAGKLWSATPPASGLGQIIVGARLPLALLYVLAFPVVGLLLGKKIAIQTALGRIAQQRSRQLATWLSDRALPACQQLAQLPGAQTAKTVTEALLDRVAPEQGEGLRRWLLRQLLHALKLPELCSATTFLEQVRVQPELARARMIETIEGKVSALGTTPFASMGWMCLLIAILTLTVHVVLK